MLKFANKNKGTVQRAPREVPITEQIVLFFIRLFIHHDTVMHLVAKKN